MYLLEDYRSYEIKDVWALRWEESGRQVSVLKWAWERVSEEEEKIPVEEKWILQTQLGWHRWMNEWINNERYIWNSQNVCIPLMAFPSFLNNLGQATYVRYFLAKQRLEMWQYPDSSGKTSTSAWSTENTTGKENYK